MKWDDIMKPLSAAGLRVIPLDEIRSHEMKNTDWLTKKMNEQPRNQDQYYLSLWREGTPDVALIGLGRFFIENELMEAELMELFARLAVGHVYIGGGGASPYWAVGLWRPSHEGRTMKDVLAEYLGEEGE